MKGYEHLVRVTDKEGRVFVCRLDCEVGSESTCTWDNEWEGPSRFEELSEHERNGCMRVD
jgi:hypothetical protein